MGEAVIETNSWKRSGKSVQLGRSRKEFEECYIALHMLMQETKDAKLWNKTPAEAVDAVPGGEKRRTAT
jgi:hypothetical protein